MSNLICNIVWIPHYRGETEVHAGGFDYVAEHGYGHELLNFDPVGGKLFGYARAKNDTINITKLGAHRDDEFVDDVRVIFISTKPSHGPVVAGWYDGARVWRKAQPGLRTIPTRPDIPIDYLLEADADRAVLIPVEERNFDIPNRTKGFPGQSSVFFPSQHPEIAQWMKRFEKFHRKCLASKSTPQVFKRNAIGRKTDAVRNALVEQAAIETVISALGPLQRDRQRDNCGWDLEFRKGNTSICVEVKGASGIEVRAEVTPNEYRTVLRVKEGRFDEGEYRLAIVTDALGGRNLHLFSLTERGDWECEFTGKRISAVERVAAAFG